MRIRSVIAIAAPIALVFLTYMTWSQRWNDPPAGPDMTTSASIHWAGVNIPVTVTCIACPSHVVVGKQRKLQFEVTLGPARQELLYAKKIGLWWEINGIGNWESPSPAIWLSLEQQTGELRGEATITVTALDESFSGFVFHFTAWDVAANGTEAGTATAIGSVYKPVPAEPPAFQVIAPYLYALLVFLLFAGAILLVQRRIAEVRSRAAQTIAEAQLKATEHPEKIRFIWELAQVKLEAYFDRNLIQVNLVFWVAVFAMIVGFMFVLVGVVLSFRNPKIWTTPLVAAVSGIITQFIGATFMVIYRSTMAQANEYMTILERINSVGMAVQVVESLQGATELQNATRAAIAKLLLGGKANSGAQRGSDSGSA